MAKTTIRPVGEPTEGEAHVNSLSFDGVLTIQVMTRIRKGQEWDVSHWEVVFTAPVGFRVLDERDTPEFWHDSVNVADPGYGAVAYEVLNGGWADLQAKASPVMGSGFYPRLREYWIGGDADCVNVLSEYEPVVSKIGASRVAA